ncbi:MAG: hypothetical protein FWG07_03660 [Treponema sp.]|nr:hypothetical protein [Treponema sp.]
MTRQVSRSETDLDALEEQHEIKRIETLKALETLGEVRRHALLQLHKTRILFRYLNWKQQEHISSRSSGDIPLQAIFTSSASAVNNPDSAINTAVPVIVKSTASYLQKVKTVRKNIIQFGIMEARVHELIGVIVKSTAVFNHQYKTTYRELFPLGFISKVQRHIRQLLHHPYFSWQEIGCLQNLGRAAGLVLKMAETPVLGARQ